MVETNEKFTLIFENVYKEDSYTSYQIHDLTDFKSESIDREMNDIKEDIMTNVKNYLKIEANQSTFIYNEIKSIVEGECAFDYTIEKVDVSFRDHYTYDSYLKDNALCTDMYEDHYFKIETKYEQLAEVMSQKKLDALHDETQELIANTEDYIANEAVCFMSNYYYTVDVVIILTKSIF